MPNASALAAIHEVVYDVLSADATLQALVDGAQNIGNFEVESPPTRFIVIGNATEQDWHSLGGIDAGWGWLTTITVHIYSYYEGDLEALQILARVSALLNFAALTVPGYQTAICEYAERPTRVLVETKGKIQRRHIPAMFTIRVHE